MSKFEVNRGNDNCISASGIGYVIIPDGVETAEYVQRCYRNHTISIGDGYGSTPMHRVKITHEALNNIDFPSGDSLGSAVVWIRESYTNKPIVIGVLKKGSGLVGRHQQRLYQEIADQLVDIFVDAINSRINITARGNDSVPGVVVITANSKKDEGDVVKLVSKDKIIGEGKTYELRLSKNIDLLINDGEKDVLSIVGNEQEFHIKDNWGNEAVFNEENCKILTPKFNIGEGKEPMVLGDTLVDLLKQLIDAILSMTVVTPVGPSGTPINAATFSSIKGKLETILSELSNTD